jgi:ribonuclease R
LSRTKKSSSPPLSHDPFADREAQNYSNPIPSREFILQKLTDVGVPLNRQEIAELLQIQDPEQLEALRRRLKAMEQAGQVVWNRGGAYGLPHKMDLVRGRVQAHPDGFGFLIPELGGDDIFLSEKQMLSLLHQDRALVRVTGKDRKGRSEGTVVEVLERGISELVGRFVQEKKIAFVEPHNRRISQDVLIPPDEQANAKNGQMVVVKLLKYPDKHQPPIGTIIQILGDELAAGMETDVAIRDHNLPNNWSIAIDEEIKTFTDQIPIQGREDIRHLSLVTIDGDDSRDFDDAVYCEPHGKGWRLLVAIADVSHYVKPNSALDLEAKERGTSVYFPDRVLPMLPERLSNELCSLNPQVDRLCMVCELIISHLGTVRRTRFFEGIMKSAARLTYKKVAAALKGDKNAVPSNLLNYIENLFQLYQKLRERREKRGAIDFDTQETRFVLNAEGKVEKIVPVIRNDAHRLIEEMMLLANVAAAEFLSNAELPFLYRVHEGPTPEKLTDLRNFLKELGLKIGGKDQPSAEHYAKLLKSIQDRPDTQRIQTVLLRSLQMAIYSPENKGHFGLAFENYAHFTSPIRRYPDLMVHRAIRHVLQGKSPAEFLYHLENLKVLGEQCSMAERRADDASRDVAYWLKCQYMVDKIGEIYTGIVTAVTAFGLFVELEGIFIEGLVHVTSLKNDYYHYDAPHHRLRGERSGTVYHLSDRLQVRVVRVNVEEKKIDLIPAEV